MVRIGLLLFLFSYYSSEAAVVINEVASKGSTSGNCGSNDWIELYNDGDEDVDLSQYILYDDKGASSADAFRFPEGTAIDAGGYLVLCNEMKLLGENGQEIADPQSPQFGIGGDDIITLAIADSADTAFATGLVRQALPHVIADQVALPDQHHQENVSFARFASSQRGAFYDYTSTPTPGTDNVATDLLTEEQLAVQHKAALEARNALATAFFNMDDQGLPVPDALPDVLELHVTMNVSEYQTMIEKAYYEVYRPFDEVKIIDPNNQNIIAATTVPGRVRTRGQATLFYAVCLDSKGDIPFQIDFGDDTPLLGMSKVYLRTHAGDFSYMRDYAMNRMLARFGLPHLRARHVQLFFNGQKNGLYSLLEAADQEYVFNRNFPDYDPNNYALYKVKTWAGDCGSYTAYANQLAQQKLDNGFQPGQQPYAFERGTHVDPILTLSLFDFDQCGAEYDQWLENVWADTTLAYEHHNKDCGDLLVEEDFMDLDIGNKDFNNVMKEFVNNFYRGDDRCSEGCENKAGIKDVVDVDQFLRVFAFYAVGTISDSPLNSEHNFYMAQTGDGLGWKIMPYDFNTAASTSCREEVCGERMIYWSITRPTCFALEDSLLAGPLLTDSNLHAQFLTYAEEFVDKVYGNQTFWKELSAHIAAMGQYVRNDYYSVFGAYYEDELSPDAASWNDESGNFPLLPLMKARTEELRSQFDALRLGTFPRGVDDYDNYDSWEPCADWRISAPNRTMCPFQCMYEGCHMEGYTVESFCDEAEAICYHGDYDERCRGILDGEQYAGMEEGTFCQDASGIPVKAVSCPNATENSKLISQTSAAAKLLGDVVATVLVSLWLCLHL